MRGVKLDERGFIKIDRQMKTNVEGVYAIGDVAGPPLLAHKGSHEGVQCVEAIHGDPHAGIDYGNIPNCTYCHPEVASVGLTEEQAREKGYEVEVGTFPWTANGRALTAGETEGFVKVIRDKKYSEVLGAHIVGPHATELIAEFVVGRHLSRRRMRLTCRCTRTPRSPSIGRALGASATRCTLGRRRLLYGRGAGSERSGPPRSRDANSLSATCLMQYAQRNVGKSHARNLNILVATFSFLLRAAIRETVAIFLMEDFEAAAVLFEHQSLCL